MVKYSSGKRHSENIGPKDETSTRLVINPQVNLKRHLNWRHIKRQLLSDYITGLHSGLVWSCQLFQVEYLTVWLHDSIFRQMFKEELFPGLLMETRQPCVLSRVKKQWRLKSSISVCVSNRIQPLLAVFQCPTCIPYLRPCLTAVLMYKVYCIQQWPDGILKCWHDY